MTLLNISKIKTLEPLAQAVKSYINDTNDFLNKLCYLPKLPGDIILCTVDVVGLYLNISHEENLYALRKWLDNRMEKYISCNILCDLAEFVIKNNILKFVKKKLKPKKGTAIETKFGLPYSVLVMADLEEQIFRKTEFY